VTVADESLFEATDGHIHDIVCERQARDRGASLNIGCEIMCESSIALALDGSVLGSCTEKCEKFVKFHENPPSVSS